MHFAQEGRSSCQLAKDIGVTRKTAWFMLHRIREMLKVNAPELLEGEVEADETFIGGKEGWKHKSKRTGKNLGRSTKKKPRSSAWQSAVETRASS